MLQEIFNKSYLGLASQGFNRSVEPSTPCLYRGPNGMKCAAGWLIPDDDYHPDMDAIGLPTSIEYIPWFKKTFNDVEFSFIRKLQTAHDEGLNPDEMIHNLNTIAYIYGLTIPETEK